MDAFSLPLLMATMGAVVGLMVGNKFRHISPEAPASVAMVLGVAGYVFHTTFVAFSGIVVVLAAFVGLYKLRGLMRDSVETFAMNAGEKVKGFFDRRPFEVRVAEIERAHRERMAALRRRDFDADTRREMEGLETKRMRDELVALHEKQGEDGYIDIE